MEIQLIIDPDACVGYGECVAEDAAAVELDENGCARALVQTASPRPGGADLRRVPGGRDHAQAGGIAPARRQSNTALIASGAFTAPASSIT